MPTLPDTRSRSLHRPLLWCGVAAAIVYPLTDIIASARYPGFSYRDQAVSELFAIGAPTSTFVVPLFSLSSALLLLFAVGIWTSAHGRRILQWIAVMMAVNAIDALVLWNVFPMHMRGVPPTFTDLMHGILAVDPFVLTAVVLSAIAFAGWFRAFTITIIALTSVFTIVGVSSAPAFMANEPTPWMGAMERAGQYAMNAWYAAFGVMLLRREFLSPGTPEPVHALSTE